MALWEEDDYGVLADRGCWALFSVTTVIVGLRLLCRVRFGPGRLGGLGLDDYITIFCVVVVLITCILVTIGSHWGLGKHMASIDAEHQMQALKWNVIVSSVLIWSFSLPKFAIIAILKRILDYGTKTTILFWGLAISSQACILATSVWWWKQCDLVERNWDLSVPGTCASVKVMADLGYFTSAFSAFLDIFFALYPIPFVMRLQMPLRSRVAVSVALGLSALAFLVSIYKLAIFGSVFEQLAKDPTYPIPYLDLLGVAEGCILLICASLPALGPLLKIAKDRLTTLSYKKSNSAAARRRSLLDSGQNKWANVKGHKLDDAEQGCVAVGSSVDDITLVSRANRNIEAG